MTVIILFLERLERHHSPVAVAVVVGVVGTNNTVTAVPETNTSTEVGVTDGDVSSANSTLSTLSNLARAKTSGISYANTGMSTSFSRGRRNESVQIITSTHTTRTQSPHESQEYQSFSYSNNLPGQLTTPLRLVMPLSLRNERAKVPCSEAHNNQRVKKAIPW
jgi:hypothetical protein